MSPFVENTLMNWDSGFKSDLVFATGGNKPISQANIHTRWHNPLLIEQGIVGDEGKPKFSPYKLRHFAVSLWGRVMLENNGFIDWDQIAEWIGHKKGSLAQDTYHHLFDDIREQNVDLVRKAEEWVLG